VAAAVSSGRDDSPFPGGGRSHPLRRPSYQRITESQCRKPQTGQCGSRREIERGVFDIEAVKQANASLIETIEESLSIADEGRKKRKQAELDLENLEAELRRTLINAGERVREQL
jgi:hypothetical protein